jgi:hypothetical protein
LAQDYTEDEDRFLVAMYSQIGAKWAEIAQAIGNKSAISIRNRHRTLQSIKAKRLKPDYPGQRAVSPPQEVEPVEMISFCVDDIWEQEFQNDLLWF